MFCTWRATVCSLITSSPAISRLLFPAATRRSTSSSRPERPCESPSAGGSTRARSGAAPSSGRSRRPPPARAALLPRRRARSTPGQERACPRHLVRRVERRARSGAPRAGRRARRAHPRGERDRTARVRDHRREHRALVAPGELLQLAAGAACASSISPDVECDLDVRRKERCPLQRLGDLRRGPADRRECHVTVPLGQTELGEAGLRLPAEAARLAVGLLGGGELAAKPQQLGPAVVGDARRGVLRLDDPSQARRASSRASDHEPPSCRISARCTRQRPVNATRSRLLVRPALRASVHSRARPTSKTSWQARITPQ